MSFQKAKTRLVIFHKEKKDIQSYSLFQEKIRSKLIKIENETDNF